jgi:predicted enzyme related to lactoylglutathione lyase
MSRVVHFEIHASKPKVLIDFYTSLFAWKFEQWGEFEYWQIVTGPNEEPGINGGLVPRRGAPAEEGQGVNAYVCTVDVKSLDKSLAKAQSLGGKVAVPKMPIPGVGWLAYVKDPDGNLFGLMQTEPGAK